MAVNNIIDLARRRLRVTALERIRRVAAKPSAISYGPRVNDLDQARRVPISSVWVCLEHGEIADGQFFPDQPDGIMMKLCVCAAGDRICVDLMLDRDEDKLVVMFVDREEEEC